MLDNSYTITYDAASVVLTKVREGNYSSDFRGVTAGGDILTMEVKHTTVPRGGTGESHLVRFNVEHYDGTGTYLKTSSAWQVIKTYDGPQVDADALLAHGGLDSFLSTSGLVAKVIARES
jgi:hypothetical protein